MGVAPKDLSLVADAADRARAVIVWPCAIRMGMT